jgi:ribosome-binding factor A
MSRRSNRVADLLRFEITDLIQRELQDPRIGLTSVTHVDLSPDLRNARVSFSVLGEDRQRADTIEALQRAKGFIKSRLAKRLRTMRRIPDLTFALDRGAEHSQHISDLLENLHDSDDPS